MESNKRDVSQGEVVKIVSRVTSEEIDDAIADDLNDDVKNKQPQKLTKIENSGEGVED